MLVEDIKKYCMSKHKAYEDYPFGDVPICYKLNGKVFAQIYPYPEDYKITLKCRCRTILSYGISGQGSQRLSLPSSATAILEYHLSG